MSKPEDIPQSTWDAAYDAVEERTFEMLPGDFLEMVEHVARAIMASERREREACATMAHYWLKDWASDLSAMWQAYVEAKSSGLLDGRKIKPEQADFFAKQFRERAEAVDGCADPLSDAIRAREPLNA